MSADRERGPRRALQLPVTFWPQTDRSNVTSGCLLNVSHGGLYIATYQPLPAGTRVEMRVEYADRVLQAGGRVIHEASHQAGEESMFKSGMGVGLSEPDSPGVIELYHQGHHLSDRGGRRRLPR